MQHNSRHCSRHVLDSFFDGSQFRFVLLAATSSKFSPVNVKKISALQTFCEEDSPFGMYLFISSLVGFCPMSCKAARNSFLLIRPDLSTSMSLKASSRAEIDSERIQLFACW